MLRTHSVLLNTALIGCTLGLVALSGCQGDSPAETTGGDGGTILPTTTNGSGGNGGGSTTSSSDSSSGTGGSSSSSSSTGGGTTCTGDVHTIKEITDGTIGPDSKVTLEGVVAMSNKFLVYGSKTSCLWGIFVSAPGLTTTGPNTGVLIESYGSNPTVPPGATDGKVYCPSNPTDAGDKLPNAKPGDVLTVTGKTSAYKPSTCGAGTASTCKDGVTTSPYDPTTETASRQIQLAQVCAGEITGTAAMPTPAVFTADQITEMKKTDNQAFFNQWGGVKVRIVKPTAKAQTIGNINQPEGCYNEAISPAVVVNRGEILLDAGIYVSSAPYYIHSSQNACETRGPWFADNTKDLIMERVDGFLSLDYCTWKLYAASPCDDYDPKSTKCVAPGPTTCF